MPLEMSNWGKCKQCGAYGWMSQHSCKPFTVIDEYEDEYTKYGTSHTDVVERMAEDYNSDEPIFDEDIFCQPVSVTDENGVTKKFNAYAQVDIQYTATEVE